MNLQQYWWLIISLEVALLIFLLFVQGGNSMLFSLGKTDEERALLVNSTGRKWEITFTMLVTFGGTIFAAFPGFYAASFGGAYWLWMLILLSFVLQAVSYEFQSKEGNLIGKKTYRIFLVINGFTGPILLGCAAATFFIGAPFYVNKENMASGVMPVINSWSGPWHGLEALADLWSIAFALAVFFLTRILGLLYFINNVENRELNGRCRRSLPANGILFLLFFSAFTAHICTTCGFAVDPDTQIIYRQPWKYLNNFLEMPCPAILFAGGVVLMSVGVIKSVINSAFERGIWFSGAGTVLAFTALFLCAGYNDTAYYPSTVDMQSSLTLSNSCSGEFTLKSMAYLSLLIPCVGGYLFYVWRRMNKRKINEDEAMHSGY